MAAAATWAEGLLAREGVRLTLGGEPTYVPENPEGAEWSFSAVGPTKLAYARKMARELLKTRMAGGAVFFSPGKQYPGEVNPRWALRMVARRDGRKLFRGVSGRKPAEVAQCETFLAAVAAKVAEGARWLPFSDPRTPPATTWVLPLDHGGEGWESVVWKLRRGQCVLNEAEGPAGLRLPLNLVPDGVTRRALVAELNAGRLCIFFPPLLQAPFSELLEVIGDALRAARIGRYELQGYVPEDTQKIWTTVGLAADPGVLEINVPPCATWREYDEWISLLTQCAESCGLRSWKAPPGDYVGGTGGGNHLLWGGPSIEENPFFTRPAWLASILRYWQRHPALAYVFTGSYVGASSQAPRPDESSKELFDIEMGYHFLETLGEGDHRALINETLRHLHTDVTGNAHRSEASFDKFWNPGWPGGTLGLLEFRAVESLPTVEWMSAVALLWLCVAVHNLKKPLRDPLCAHGGQLHDRYFLPTCLWDDLVEVFDDLSAAGCELPRETFRAIWEWRFPEMLTFAEGGARLVVRRAHESWPLLCETPVEGGSTSRFVDTSMHRLEFCGNDAFARTYEVIVHDRKLRLADAAPGCALAGLRYRRSCLYPCLHPGIAPHLPLDVVIVRKDSGLAAAAFQMGFNQTAFTPIANPEAPKAAKRCRPIHRGALTHDLRLQ